MRRFLREHFSVTDSYVVLAFMTALAPEICLAVEQTPRTAVRAFLYDVNLEFLFLDELSALNRPAHVDFGNNHSKPEGLMWASTSDRTSSPTMGLRLAKFGFDWRVSSKFSVELVLRPDAAGDALVREVDTRAGQVIEESPSVRFIDQYQFIYRPSSSSVRLGVEKEVMESYRVVADTLDFGLRVRGPEKAMAAVFDMPKLFEFNQGRDGAGVGVSAAALSGRDERHDRRHYESGGSGESPAKKDPYWGVSGSVTWTLEGDSRFGIGMATIEERFDGMKVRNQWYQAGLRRDTALANGGRWLLAMEARQLRQGFALEGTDISSVSLSSVGITTSYERLKGEGPMMGLWIGSGELHPVGVLSESKPAKGSQLNFGWRWQMEDSLEVSALIAREWRRDGAMGGGTKGGFVHGDSTRSALSRFAVGVRYLTGGQI
jgi:hypothetical protein